MKWPSFLKPKRVTVIKRITLRINNTTKKRVPDLHITAIPKNSNQCTNFNFSRLVINKCKVSSVTKTDNFRFDRCLIDDMNMTNRANRDRKAVALNYLTIKSCDQSRGFYGTHSPHILNTLADLCYCVKCHGDWPLSRRVVVAQSGQRPLLMPVSVNAA